VSLFWMASWRERRAERATYVERDVPPPGTY
jgi:hypothetical protein